MYTSRAMITFKSGGIRFTYRVGGILIQGEHILFQTASNEEFFFLPGGRAELGGVRMRIACTRDGRRVGR